MPETKNYVNLGVIEGRRPRDFVAGQLPYEIRLNSGNWKPFLPPGEWQKQNFVDTMACVTFSLLNCIETQEKFLTGNQINYSDRWIAMMSGTTHQGNFLPVVADTVRKYGLVREESWPSPSNFTWESYYEVPTSEKMASLKAEGVEWLKTHTLDYEWLGTDLITILKELKMCPLQIIRPGHAIEGFYEETEIMNYFDSYNPFEKSIERIELTDALKPLLTLKKMSNAIFVHKTGTQEYGFYLPATSTESIRDKALNLGLTIEKADGSVDFSQAKEIKGL